MVDKSSKQSIYLTKPHLVHKIWGSEELAERKGARGKIGESWEVSRHPDGESTISGRPLSTLFNENELPYLIKFLDTTDLLSVQVHPDSAYAKRVEKSSGKTECWIIIRANPGAGIYLGFERGISKEDFTRAIKRGEDLTPMLRFYPVSEGDFFYVPAGAVHAIGSGVLLCEVQESSGLTYRVDDWNRVDERGVPRELHIDKALDVLNFDGKFNNEENFRIRRDLFEETNLRIDLVHHNAFNVELVRMRAGEIREFFLVTHMRVPSIVVLSGSLKIFVDGNEFLLAELESALLDTGVKSLKIEASKESHFLWVK